MCSVFSTVLLLHLTQQQTIQHAYCNFSEVNWTTFLPCCWNIIRIYQGTTYVVVKIVTISISVILVALSLLESNKLNTSNTTTELVGTALFGVVVKNLSFPFTGLCCGGS
jgi:hypothetical protein